MLPEGVWWPCDHVPAHCPSPDWQQEGTWPTQEQSGAIGQPPCAPSLYQFTNGKEKLCGLPKHSRVLGLPVHLLIPDQLMGGVKACCCPRAVRQHTPLLPTHRCVVSTESGNSHLKGTSALPIQVSSTPGPAPMFPWHHCWGGPRCGSAPLCAITMTSVSGLKRQHASST